MANSEFPDAAGRASSLVFILLLSTDYQQAINRRKIFSPAKKISGIRLIGGIDLGIICMGIVPYRGGIRMAKKRQVKLPALLSKRRKLFDKLGALTEMVNGSVTQIYRRCGKPGCKCAQGEKHGPAQALLFKEDGRSQMVYLPRGSLTECRRRRTQYDRFKDLTRQILSVNRQILKLQIAQEKGGKKT